MAQLNGIYCICTNAIPLIIYTSSQPIHSLIYIFTTFTQGKVGSWILYIDETYNVMSNVYTYDIYIYSLFNNAFSETELLLSQVSQRFWEK